MKKIDFSILFKLVLVVGCSLGIWLTGARSENIASFLSFYTIQSNLLCLILFVILLFSEVAGKVEKGSTYYLVKGAVTMAILVTFLVYHFILRPQLALAGVDYNPNSLNDFLIHTFTPLMVVFDYVLFDQKGKYKGYYPLLWALLPLAYPVYVYIYAVLGGRFDFGTSLSKYPYFFLNVDELGVGGVLAWIVGIASGFLIISYLYIGLDRVLASRKPTYKVAE